MSPTRTRQTLWALVFPFALLAVPLALAGTYSWQEPHAKVLPKGDLSWAPQPFQFRPGGTVRYIDYASGSDENPGSREKPWKHHPWDPSATGKAQKGRADTYVFKRGVVYRGALAARNVSGKQNTPIQLTSDPDWGSGQAALLGSIPVKGDWKKVEPEQAPEGMKDTSNIWMLRIQEDYTPWALWRTDGDSVERLPIARTPNWQVETWDDVKSQWWQWENGKRVPNGSYGIDTQHLTEDPDYYKGAIIRSEWGIVMSTPVPVPVTDFDPEKRALSFEGFFTKHYGRRDAEITKGMRYYLENKPHYLDESGEWWFDGKGTLYLQMDSDPNEARFELARHKVLIDLRDAKHVRISGLAFHYTNLFTYGLPGFGIYEDDHQIGAVRLQGNVVDVAVVNNTFSHVAAGVVLDIDTVDAVGEDVLIADNDMQYLDYEAIDVENSYSEHPGHGAAKPEVPTRINGLRILRNRIRISGFNPHRGSHGHTVTLSFPETAEIAGNVLDKVWGSGLFIFGGKPSGQATDDRPLSRILVHHNKVTNPLLNSNDWGGIETWQGGPFYVYNNVSGNPGGYRHWRWLRQRDAREHQIGHVGTRFGHAYYMDGAFKNYHFNNIAWGKENDLRSPLMNTAAFQEIHGFQNNAFNNTIYMFGAGSRRQTPEPGRNLYLGNIWSNISDYVFAHGPIPGVKEVNAADVGEVGDHFEYKTVGYANNVFHKIERNLSTLEATDADAVKAMRESLEALGAYATNVGTIAEVDPLQAAAKHDFRPAEGSAAKDYGVRPFVPWSLYATVGEWQFYRNQKNPREIIDSHWYMTPLHNDRTTYEHLPTWSLMGVNTGQENFVSGPLEDWTRGAMKLDGREEYLYAELPSSGRARDVIAKADKPVTQKEFDGWLTITHPSAIIPGHKFQIEVQLAHSVPEDSIVQAFLGARRHRGWGGTQAMAEEIRGFKASEQPLTFTMTPKVRGGLKEYVIVVHYGKQRGWDNHVKAARVTVPLIPAREVADPSQFRTPDIDTHNMLIEAHAKIEKGSGGVLVEKLAQAGYSLTVNGEGHLSFLLVGKGGRDELTSNAPAADGQWHHIVAQADRKAGTMTIFVDGQVSARGKLSLGPRDSLSNESRFFVGGTDEGRNLAVTIDFLRVTRGTLADSRTSIDELRAWQYDGPFLGDFTGKRPGRGKRDAGAIEGDPTP